MLNRPPLLDDQIPNKRQLTEQAITLASQGRWEDAIQANRRLLTYYPQEADAYNRLGKALTELGRYGEARDAYAQALTADPGNSIARRNLDRLKVLAERDQAAPAGTTKNEKMDPRLFVEEPGKTGVTALQRPAGPEVLARMNSGDLVRLRPSGHALVVENGAGEQLGSIEPRLAQRLIHFMHAGNQYQAAVMSTDDHEARIFLRETVQHPSLAGRPTFPTRAEGVHRAYTRDSLFRYELEEDEDEYDEAEGDYAEHGADHHEDEHDEEEPSGLIPELNQHGFGIEREEE